MVNTSGDERINGAIDALNLVAEASPNFWNTLYDVGDKPVFVNAMPKSQVPTGAHVNFNTREISVSDDRLHDPDKLISLIALELENLKRFPDFAAIQQRVRQGEIQSADKYAVGMERIEYGTVRDTARTFREARNTLLAHGYGQNPANWYSNVSAHGKVKPKFDSFGDYLAVQQGSGHTALYENYYHSWMNNRRRSSIAARTDPVDEAGRTR